MRIRHPAAAAAIVAAGFLWACATTPPAPVKDGELMMPSDYKTWPKFLSAVQRPDAKQVREIYMNPVARNATAAGGFGNGTMFVMENYAARARADGTLETGADGKLVKGDLAARVRDGQERRLGCRRDRAAAQRQLGLRGLAAQRRKRRPRTPTPAAPAICRCPARTSCTATTSTSPAGPSSCASEHARRRAPWYLGGSQRNATQRALQEQSTMKRVPLYSRTPNERAPGAAHTERRPRTPAPSRTPSSTRRRARGRARPRAWALRCAAMSAGPGPRWRCCWRVVAGWPAWTRTRAARADLEQIDAAVRQRSRRSRCPRPRPTPTRRSSARWCAWSASSRPSAPTPRKAKRRAAWAPAW